MRMWGIVQTVTVGRAPPRRRTRVAGDFRSNPHIEDVDLSYTAEILATPNDPYYALSGTWGQEYEDLWGLHRINAEPAWDLTTASPDVIVADIDTGVDRTHADLAENMWVNPGEIPGNGLDDDDNGYIDDVHGWDWVSNDGDPIDDHGHGTHTAGTIAGVGNNGRGVVGVTWSTKIMALKFLSAGGSGSSDDAILALQYAADMGAQISSNSWGCDCSSPALDDAIRYVHERGLITVVAAGNSFRRE